MVHLAALPPMLLFILTGVPITLLTTASAFAVGAAVAVPMALVRMADTPWASPIIGGWVEFFLVTPPLVHVLWAYYALSIAFGIRLSAVTVVILALSASTSGQLTEIFRAAFQAVPPTQREAGIVPGLGPLQRFSYLLFPQAMRHFMAPATSTAAALAKDSAIAAVIGVPEILNRGQVESIETFRPLEALTLVAIVYFVVIYPLVVAGSHLEWRSRMGFGHS